MTEERLTAAWRAACMAVPGGSHLWGYAVRDFGERPSSHRTPLALWAAVFGDLLANEAVRPRSARLAPFQALLHHRVPLCGTRRHVGHELLDAFNAQCLLVSAEFVVSEEEGDLLAQVLDPLIRQKLPDISGAPWFETLLRVGGLLGWFSPRLAALLRARCEATWLREDLPSMSVPLPVAPSARL